MTATNMCSDFSGFRYHPPLNICGRVVSKLVICGRDVSKLIVLF